MMMSGMKNLLLYIKKYNNNYTLLNSSRFLLLTNII